MGGCGGGSGGGWAGVGRKFGMDDLGVSDSLWMIMESLSGQAAYWYSLLLTMRAHSLPMKVFKLSYTHLI